MQIKDLAPTAERFFDVESDAGVVLEAVQFSYGTRKIIDRLSVSASPGTWLQILGENGTGKSTLAQLIAGHLRPDQGRVRVTSIQRVKPRIVLAMSEPTILDADLYANLDLGRGLKRDTIQKQLSALGIWSTLKDWNLRLESPLSLANRNLSAGERQLIGLARALLQEMDVLILDEATSHLSTALERHFLQQLKISNPSLILFMISHRASLDGLINEAVGLVPIPSPTKFINI